LSRVNLTDTEVRTLRCFADGATTKTAARELDREPETIKWRMRLIRAKLGASTTTQAVVVALRERII